MTMQFLLPLKRMLAGATLVFSLGIFGSSALAQQNATAPVLPSHLTVATDVLKASGMGTMFQNSLPNVIGGLRQNFSRARPELVKDIEEALKVVEAQIPDAANDGIQAVARGLAARMSEEELKSVLTFMTSPAGKKYVEVIPNLMEEVVPFLEQWTQAIGGAMNKLFQDEMLKRGHKL